MIRSKDTKESHIADKQIIAESVGDIIDLLSDCSRGASVFMMPPRKGDNIQQVQVLDLRKTSEFRKSENPIPDDSIGTYRAFIFTIGKHGPFECTDCYNRQVEREKAEGGRREVGLSWTDIRRIVQIADSVCNSLDYEQIKNLGEEGYYTKILQQFKKDSEVFKKTEKKNRVENPIDLPTLTKDEANRLISYTDKRKWVEIHNEKGNFYSIDKEGVISDVSPAGWWY